jgi:hypothetical protein
MRKRRLKFLAPAADGAKRRRFREPRFGVDHTALREAGRPETALRLEKPPPERGSRNDTQAPPEIFGARS